MPRAGRPGGGSLYGQGGSGARRADVLYEENDEQRRSVIALVRGCWRGALDRSSISMDTGMSMA